MRFAIVAIAVLAIGVLTAVPTAGQQFFSAIIDGPQQVPPSGSPGLGLGCMTLDANGGLTYDIAFSGLLAPESAAHFHGPAPIGVNTGVVIGLPLGSPKAGLAGPLTAAQQADLASGLWYINIHSTLFPGGEIRGQVMPAAFPCTTPVEETTWGHVKELYRAES